MCECEQVSRSKGIRSSWAKKRQECGAASEAKQRERHAADLERREALAKKLESLEKVTASLQVRAKVFTFLKVLPIVKRKFCSPQEERERIESAIRPLQAAVESLKEKQSRAEADLAAAREELARSGEEAATGREAAAKVLRDLSEMEGQEEEETEGAEAKSNGRKRGCNLLSTGS